MDDAAHLSRLADELADGVDAHLAGWMSAVVIDRIDGPLSPDDRAAIEQSAEAIAASVRRLLGTDIDAQRANPLALVRNAVGPLTEVLRRHGVAPAQRDADAERLHPDDVYDLTPASFADIHPDLHGPGIAWGAAKAHTHLSRRRAEGLR